MPVLIPWSTGLAEALLPLAVLLPLVAGVLSLRFPRVSDFTPVFALPALLLSIGGDVHTAYDTVLLGTHLRVDAVSGIWLSLTALLWLTSGWFGVYYMREDPRRQTYAFFFLAAMSGNIGLVVAGDPIVFVTGFAVMSFASYGLVVHNRRPESMRAGRVYLAMAVLGEVLQFSGMARALFPAMGRGVAVTFLDPSWIAGLDALTVVLLMLGFGVKAGLLGLHMWLPMAHPVAPTPASAVLSGSMIKAGLIGWMLVLPLGSVAMPVLSHVLAVLGLAGAFGAAAYGVFQRKAKAVLAYSSVSQMGLIITLFGVALAEPGAWAVLSGAVVLYMVHHGIAKCALFLSVGLRGGRLMRGAELCAFWAGVALSALALCGAPLTSGMAAKYLMKGGVGSAGEPVLPALVLLLTLGAAGTTLLMVRFVHVLRRDTPGPEHHSLSPWAWAPWGMLLAAVAICSWFLAVRMDENVLKLLRASDYWFKSVWPIAVGVALYASGRLVLRAARRFELPPGDIYLPVARVSGAILGRLHSAFRGVSEIGGSRRQALVLAIGRAVTVLDDMLSRAESSLKLWRAGGLAATVAAIVLFWLAFR